MSFKCVDNCEAECCGCIPLEKTLIKQYRKQIQRKFEPEDIGKGLIHPLTKDGCCIFLNKVSHCAIYKTRPYICKLYGTIRELQCPFVEIDGRGRTKDEEKRKREEIKKYVAMHWIGYHEKYEGGKFYLRR